MENGATPSGVVGMVPQRALSVASRSVTALGKWSVLSDNNILNATPSWRVLEMHAPRRAESLARASAGNSMAARMAMMAMTTSSSISVNADHFSRDLEYVFAMGWVCVFIGFAWVLGSLLLVNLVEDAAVGEMRLLGRGPTAEFLVNGDEL